MCPPRPHSPHNSATLPTLQLILHGVVSGAGVWALTGMCGGTECCRGGGGYSQALYDEIQASGAAGGLFIAAAGNDASNMDATPSYPASFNLDNIISVGAVDQNDAIASFSNYGQ